MFSSGEMEVLSAISLGYDSIQQLSEKTGKSVPQIYKIVGTLRNNDTVRLSDGKVIPERKTHITLLLDVLSNSVYAKISLSGHGLDILAELMEPKGTSEVSSSIGLHQTSVSKKMRQLEAIGMISKNGRTYVINDRLWPELRSMVDSYAEYNRVNDMRAPPGSKIYYSSEEEVIFANNNSYDLSKTAFSKYEENGIKFYLGTYYCINPPRNVTRREIFLHSLYVTAAGGDWRLRMMALIFYVKFKNELGDIEHPLRYEMDRVLKGERVVGWVDVEEMQERADIHGVVLR